MVKLALDNHAVAALGTASVEHSYNQPFPQPVPPDKAGFLMNIFDSPNRSVGGYANYVTSFVAIQDNRIQERLNAEPAEGLDQTLVISAH